MKTMILTAIIFLSIFVARGQQNLSYSYDGAGNRISRTIVVDSQNMSTDVVLEERTYVDSLGGKQIRITSTLKDTKLLVDIKDSQFTFKGRYSISNRNGKVIKNKTLHAKATSICLNSLPSGDYTLKLSSETHTSIWNLRKL
ncbi:hypothetical protein [Sphingobacterium paludis]|uniref:YD repeat-containing protein n=1 Tax=Sphingobacterium paludis TaxID=1476465 RepID=A0A4R7CSJ9_9SPHI|nr:hypothetical protein [Sphingobacterium paludis]TDS09814.1 YD repeat-containing protein [Sphingobacterium paludis]